MLKLVIVEGCTLPIDITLIASNGIRLGGHSTNLAVFSEGFFPAIMPSPAKEETPRPPLTATYDEEGDVLSLILQYMHSNVPPDLKTVPFEVAKGFAYAAHKYVVYHAIPISKMFMEYVLPFFHPVLSFTLNGDRHRRIIIFLIGPKLSETHSMA
jgi:hypothetical protein